MHPLALATLLALAAAPPAPDAGLFPAQLVVDLEGATAPEMRLASTPTELVEGPGGAFYFLEDDGVHGRELWRSDGTPLGTHLVRDVCPGQCSGVPMLMGGSLASLNGGLLFSADDGAHGMELWVSDGTALGTRLVRDVRPGPASSRPHLLTLAAGQVFFAADDGAHGDELWRSDGTAGGTYLVAEIVPGPAFGWIVAIEPGNGFLFVGVDASDEVAGLYRVDGSTPLALHLAPGRLPSGIYKGAPFATLPDGRLLFQGGQTEDAELWVSDGTAAGTAELVDLVPAAGSSSYPSSFVRSGSEVYFTAQASGLPGRSTGLWRTDGSVAGTVEVPLPPEVWVGGYIASISTHALGSRLFFAASDPAHGLEPWVLDGTGAHLLSDLAPGAASSLATDVYAPDRLFGIAGGRYVFIANDGVEGPELWASDGTAAGTARISAIGPGSASLGVPYQYAFSRRVTVYEHLSFVRWSAASGRELWWSDGSAAGTVRLRAVNVETSAFYPTRTSPFFDFPGISCAAAAGPRLVFAAETASRWAATVFGTDGTAAGSGPLALLRLPAAEVYFPSCTRTGSSTLFFAFDGSAPALLASGGEPLSTNVLVGLGADGSSVGSSSEPALVPFGGRWVGGSEASSSPLWLESDLSPAGTLATAMPEPLTGLAAGGSVVWAASGSGLLVGDGTAGGMSPVPPADGLPLDGPPDLAPLGDIALFLNRRDATGRELWRSDGTGPGTTLLTDLTPGPASTFVGTGELVDTRGKPREVVALDSVAILVADDGVHGTELWRSDGTAAGTVLVKDIYAGSYPSTPRDLVRVGDLVYFGAEDELHGLELWVTDGTSEGTHLVRDLVPGADSSVPQELTDVKGRLYFTAWRPAWGREAFQTDGTEAGTLQVADVWTGPESSSPSRFAAVRDTLYFAANDGVHGFELFKVIDATLLDVFADGFESGALAAWSRRSALAPLRLVAAADAEARGSR